MKADILDLTGRKVKSIDLPRQFNEEYRPDLIKRAFLAIRSHKRQPYGAKENAGNRYSSKLSKRRRKYRGSYGRGISRIPRKILTRRGTQFYWIGATIPGTVGGRRAHPPKPEKKFEQKINIKERRKAIRSAISATVLLDVVKKRGHNVGNVPIILESKFQDLEKSKDVLNVFNKIGLKDEMKRVSIRKVRAGRGKARGRRYKKKKGPLLIVSEKCPLINSSKNLPGVEVVKVKDLNVELLAPGSDPGRLCVWSNKAIEILEKNNLFFKNESKLKKVVDKLKKAVKTKKIKNERSI
jgi:large subunit ribosomal protein L4e